MNNNDSITSDKILEYRKLIEAEMLKQGASENELLLLKDETIINAIRNNRNPVNIAWAILQ